MKILDIPQSGKRGLNVSQDGAFGQISRTLAIPANPRTPRADERPCHPQPRGRRLAGSRGSPTGRLDGRGQGSQEQHPPGPEWPPQRLPVVHQDQLHPGPVRPGAGGRAAGATAVPRPGARRTWSSPTPVARSRSSSPARPARARTPSSAPPRRSARAVRPAATSGSWAPARPPCWAPRTSRASTRPATARRRSARRCTSRSTSSLTGGKACP